MRGKIVKGIAGFYYVYAVPQKGQGAVFACKAKGIFRKDHTKPYVGDDVEIDILDEAGLEGNIKGIYPRKNELIRPAVANVDQALVIFAITKPEPNFNLLDRFLVMMGRQGLPCIICLNKLDEDEKGDGERFAEIYRSCGYTTFPVSARREESLEGLKALLRGKTTTVAGPSGVGKSSIVNLLQKNVRMETGNISEKIQRGKHTTRHVELITVDEETYILDTPGFSSLDLPRMEKEELGAYYPEFAEYEPFCQFGGCAHIREKVCGVKAAVEEGRIHRMRYENYTLLYEELKNRRKY